MPRPIRFFRARERIVLCPCGLRLRIARTWTQWTCAKCGRAHTVDSARIVVKRKP